jgi:inner membrane protein involved in colicin E2 resistance
MTTQSLLGAQNVNQIQTQGLLFYLVFVYLVILCLVLKNGTIALRLGIKFVFTVLATRMGIMAVTDVVQMKPPKERRDNGYRAI